MTAPAIARLSGVSHRYGAIATLQNIELTLPAGGTVGFLGPDGVGKSTLLSLIAGVRKIQTGTVEVLDGDLRDRLHRHAVMPRIAYMPQGLGKNLYATLSVFENLDFFGRLFGQPAAERARRIDELLTATGLAPFLDRPAGKLSGGMKQKLGLCCALIHDPDLLILDEPTTGVDPLSRRQFWQLIDRLRARRPGMSVLVATAYMEEADVFDRLVAVDAGRILATGTPQELKARTATTTLEATFIALLPEEKRGRHHGLTIPPRTHHSDQPAIEARDLTRCFGDFTAVDRVSFRIEQGEIFGFLGSNGCGKTTTMKMLTGLLPATAGSAWLFGLAVNPRNIETRKRVGYMSQGFSLYGELSVRRNLDLHARIFHLPATRMADRVNEMMDRFGLADAADALPNELPLGMRQRLSLAVALIHEPDMLILDEPTSGVDPIARDAFWELLIDLSRRQGVTIFISTHFMNEAARCDRISLMHAGRVLAQGTPAELVAARNAGNLEEAFIACLEDATGLTQDTGNKQPDSAPAAPVPATAEQPPRFSRRRLWAYARREAMELRRDPIRLAFALLGPIVLMVAFGYGISFDVEQLPYAVLDRDQTPQSRTYLENFKGSRYFVERPPIADPAELERRLQNGELKVAIEIPPEFGKKLKQGRQPEIGVWVDGAVPFRGETSLGYVQGVHGRYLQELARRDRGDGPLALPVAIATRFRYNQSFASVYAMVPGVIMLLLALIPTMLTAVGVVREKELGSITNLYATPVTGLEFLLGKQLPYIGIALIAFISLLLLTLVLFHVPVKGGFATLVTGVLLYVIATTGFGLLISTFTKTQIAAVFATAIATFLPAVSFSGFITPIASLTGGARVMGYAFPSLYFQQISVGTFTKALGFAELWPNHVGLAVLALIYLLLTRLRLQTRER